MTLGSILNSAFLNFKIRLMHMCKELAYATPVFQSAPRGGWQQLRRLWVSLYPESPVGIFECYHLTLNLLVS